jgi:hypothetical protein
MFLAPLVLGIVFPSVRRFQPIDIFLTVLTTGFDLTKFQPVVNDARITFVTIFDVVHYSPLFIYYAAKHNALLLLYSNLTRLYCDLIVN